MKLSVTGEAENAFDLVGGIVGRLCGKVLHHVLFAKIAWSGGKVI